MNHLLKSNKIMLKSISQTWGLCYRNLTLCLIGFRNYNLQLIKIILVPFLLKVHFLIHILYIKNCSHFVYKMSLHLYISSLCCNLIKFIVENIEFFPHLGGWITNVLYVPECSLTIGPCPKCSISFNLYGITCMTDTQLL